MQDEATIIEGEVSKFLADPRTIRYIQCGNNMDAMLVFLERHGLAINHRNLLFAHDSLQDTLELIPFQEPITIEPPTPALAPAPTPQQPTPQSVMPVKVRTIMYRNGQPIEGTVKRYGDR